jgi:hypothetical protein
MPIDQAALDSVARTYVTSMTSIRGRRVHRLIVREFVRFDHVLPATTEQGTSALIALAEDGGLAVCVTDGRGGSVDVVRWRRLESPTVTSSYDLTKDSLPVLTWTIWHPSFERIGGSFLISGADLSRTERDRMARIFQTSIG